MAAEYTGIGQLFSVIIGASPVIPILIIGIVTLLYTTVGGLYVSIVTDQYQAIFSLILLAIVSVYVAATFRPGALPPLPPQLALNTAGWSSIVTLSCGLISAALYSDAMW